MKWKIIIELDLRIWIRLAIFNNQLHSLTIVIHFSILLLLLMKLYWPTYLICHCWQTLSLLKTADILFLPLSQNTNQTENRYHIHDYCIILFGSDLYLNCLILVYHQRNLSSMTLCYLSLWRSRTWNGFKISWLWSWKRLGNSEWNWLRRDINWWW